MTLTQKATITLIVALGNSVNQYTFDAITKTIQLEKEISISSDAKNIKIFANTAAK